VEKYLVNIETGGAKDSHSFFLASDLHIEDVLFDEKQFRHDFNLAREKEARIYINGDVISGIVKTDLKRHAPSGDKHADRDDAIDRIIDEGYEKLKPYVNNIDLIGCGNHELSLLKYHHTEPTRRMIALLNQSRSKELPAIKHGGYTGFIRISLLYAKGRSRQSYDIFYNHGQGGSAPVTKGAIDLNRYQYAVADLIWLGHKHQRMLQNLDALYLLNGQSNLIIQNRFGLITGCYLKQAKEYDIESTGFQMDYGEEKMRTPQAVGGAMLTLRMLKAPGKIIPKIELMN
jgi:hypothetical protein